MTQKIKKNKEQMSVSGVEISGEHVLVKQERESRKEFRHIRDSVGTSFDAYEKKRAGIEKEEKKKRSEEAQHRFEHIEEDHVFMIDPKDSVHWGVRWLYHKAQFVKNNQLNWMTWEEAAEAYHKKGDLKYRDSIIKIYRQGIDGSGIKIWMFVFGLLFLSVGASVVFGLSGNATIINQRNDTIQETLKNGEYHIDGKRISLQNGVHFFTANLTNTEKMQVNPFDRYDGPYSVRYELDTLGDLNGDGIQDDVVALGTSYGGTGYYINLAAMLFAADGTYRQVGMYRFDDRDAVQSLSIRNGIIEVKSVVHAENDPLCCPSVYETKKLTLTDFLSK